MDSYEKQWYHTFNKRNQGNEAYEIYLLEDNGFIAFFVLECERELVL